MLRSLPCALALAIASTGCSSTSHHPPNADLGEVIPGGVGGVAPGGKGAKGGAAGSAGSAGSPGLGGAGGEAGSSGFVDAGVGLPWGTSPCGGCLQTQCATEATACMIEVSCNAYFFNCYSGCPIGGTGQPDPQCLSACAAKAPITAQWTQLQACLGAMRQATGACTVQCSQ